MAWVRDSEEALQIARRRGERAGLPSSGMYRPAQLCTGRRGARLSAQRGSTNREIAAALVLAERTVETHISNVLGKLGLASRREIAAWAIAAGLAPPPILGT